MSSAAGSWAGPWPGICAPSSSSKRSTWPSACAIPAGAWSTIRTGAARQYTSLAFGRRLRESGIAASTGSVGDCYDNALAESFFASLETELIDRSSWRTRADARLAVFDYIEAFDNPHRRHSALEYLSPAEFERRYRSETIAA
jgi:transposase InsO family protein